MTDLAKRDEEIDVLLDAAGDLVGEFRRLTSEASARLRDARPQKEGSG
jgi:hypothetical protein